MTFEPIEYKYALNVKLSQVPALTGLSNMFPSVEDLVISSRKFEKFEEAVMSANSLVNGITASLNAAVEKQQFKLVSEINPKHTGKATISRDWGGNEVAKLWIVDDLKPKGNDGAIRAVGLAQLLEVHAESVSLS